MVRSPASVTPSRSVRRARHVAAIRLAHAWMDRCGVNQRGLAQRLGEDPSTLSRFLDPQSGHDPRPGRPAMMRVLEKVERYCSTADNIHEADDFEPDGVVEDDEALWARNHRWRLRTLRDELDAAHALVLVGEPTSQALCGPDGYASAMCCNVLLTLASLLDRLEPGAASPELVLRTVERADRLERTAIARMEPGRADALPHKVRGYAGLVRGHGGLHLDDGALVRRGVGGMLRAAREPHEPIDGLWNNALTFLDLLYARGREEAVELGAWAAEIARDDRGDTLRNALTVVVARGLFAHWSEIAPDVLALAEREAAS